MKKLYNNLIYILIFTIEINIIYNIETKKPRLSVIVPVYNVERDYLEKLINLFIIQPLKEIEYIIVDDNSTDGTGEYLDTIAKIDNRFTVVHKFRNGGIATSRNIGLNFVESDYLTFTDDDDLFKINVYDSLIKEMEKDKSIDLIQYNSKQIFKSNENSLLFLRYNRPRIRYYLKDMGFSRRFCCTVWDKIIKSEIIFKYNLYFPKTIIWEDGYFLVMIFPYLKKMKYAKQFHYFWRQRETSFSHTRTLNETIHLESIKYCLTKVFENWKENNVLENNCDLFYYVLNFGFYKKENIYIHEALLVYKRYRKMLNDNCIRQTYFSNRQYFRKFFNELNDLNENKYEILINKKNCIF